MYILVYTIGDMLLYQISDAFQKEKLPFAIIGGYALALQGIVRATIDVDLVLHLKLADYQKAEKILKTLGLQSRLPISADDVIKMRKEYIENRNLLAWSFVDYNNHANQVDLLITTDLKQLKIDFVRVAGRKLPVASLESLLKLKTLSNRPKDQIDIQNIKEKLYAKK